MRHWRWEEQAAICRAVLEGRAEAVFAERRIPLVEQARYRWMANEIVAHTVRRHSSFSRYFAASIKNPIRLSTGLSAVIGTLFMLAALGLFTAVDLADRTTYPILGAVAGFCAISVAAIGWGVSGWIAHRNNRSRYTLDVVAARYAQTAFTDALRGFNEVFKGVAINEATVAALANDPDPEKRKAVQGLRYLVNYFEFIAVGVLEGEIDEKIVAKTLRGNLIYIYDRCATYIIDLQRTNPRTLENFTALRLHYRD